MKDEHKTIGWSLAGEGKGHSTRNLMLMLEMAAKGYRIDAYTYGDSHHALQEYFASHPNPAIKLFKIPGFEFHYDSKGRFHFGNIITKNVTPMVASIRGFRPLVRKLKQMDYDLYVMDFEPFFSRAVKEADLSGQQIQVSAAQAAMAYGELDIPEEMTRAQYMLTKGFLRAYEPKPDQILISTFFKPESLPRYCRFVGGVVRKEIQDAKPRDDGHVLVYAKPIIERLLVPMIDEVAQRTGQRFIVYTHDPSRTPMQAKSVTMKKAGIGGDFLGDFIRSSGVIGTGGTELATEAAWLGKPIFAVLQTYQYEQYVSGHYIRKCGLGDACLSVKLSQHRIEDFIERLPEFSKSVRKHKDRIAWGMERIPKILESYLL